MDLIRGRCFWITV